MPKRKRCWTAGWRAAPPMISTRRLRHSMLWWPTAPRAFVNFIRQDHATALEDLERALDLAPTHVAAMAGQALTLMSLGRTELGQSVLRRALDLHPWLPERHMLIKSPGEEL